MWESCCLVEFAFYARLRNFQKFRKRSRPACRWNERCSEPVAEMMAVDGKESQERSNVYKGTEQGYKPLLKQSQTYQLFSLNDLIRVIEFQ